jgi:hypothetical protein
MPDIDPEEISMSDIGNGEIEYSKLIIEQIEEKALPISPRLQSSRTEIMLLDRNVSG